MLPMTSVPSAFAAFAASQLRSPMMPPSPSLAHLLQSPHFQNMLQSQVAALQNQHISQMTPQEPPAKSPRTPSYNGMRKRVGGSTMKTAKVWRFFDELPVPEQAAECRLCRKKIKATNSSTTGMIRHLRSCHVTEYQQVQEARQSCMLMKMEEKAKVQMLREMGNDGIVIVRPQQTKKCDSEQKSPSGSSSASDTASSTTSSTVFTHLNPLPALVVPQGLPAPKPVKIVVQNENTEVEEQEQPTNLSTKPSAFASIMKREPATPPSTTNVQMNQQTNDVVGEDDESKKLNAQIALMLLMDHHPAQIVDRPGFRQLIRFLKPSHNLPCSATFQTELIPEIMSQIRQFGAMMMINNPILNPFDPLTTMISQQIDSSHNSSFESDIGKRHNKTEEDSDSASSADTEGEMSSRIEVLHNYLGSSSLPQDELSSLVTVCHNLFSYFEDHPTLHAELKLNHPLMDNNQPSLLKELHFVASNAEQINSYIRHTPDMSILPVSDSQQRLLADILHM